MLLFDNQIIKSRTKIYNTQRKLLSENSIKSFLTKYPDQKYEIVTIEVERERDAVAMLTAKAELLHIQYKVPVVAVSPWVMCINPCEVYNIQPFTGLLVLGGDRNIESTVYPQSDIRYMKLSKVSPDIFCEYNFVDMGVVTLGNVHKSRIIVEN